MTKHWKRSRITKALTDSARAGSFKEAEARLDAVRIAVVLGFDQGATAAGQAAVLTAVATARKCFGRVTLVSQADAPLIAALPLGGTVYAAARRLGGNVSRTWPARTTHAIIIGEEPINAPWMIRCWWGRWLAGTRAREETDGSVNLQQDFPSFIAPTRDTRRRCDFFFDFGFDGPVRHCRDLDRRLQPHDDRPNRD